jgi:DNA-binding transcriptional LysR family regulator
MIDRYLLRYFLAVVDHGNFTRAARHCRVSQPTLSAGIAKLEGLLDRQRFKRTNRRVELTSAGSRLVDHARKIEAEFIEVARSVVVEAPVGIVRIGVLSSLPATWCEAIAHAVKGATDRVEIVDGRSRDLRSLLSRGRIGAAVTTLLDSDRPDFTEKYLTEPYMLGLAKTHILAEREVISAEELSGETMLVRRDCEALSEVSRHFTSRGIRPFIAARTFSEERAIGYVRAGLGITVLPRCFSQAGLATVALTGFSLTRSIGLVYSPRGLTEPLIKERLAPVAKTVRSLVRRTET